MSSNRRQGNVRRFHSAACDLRMATVRLGQSEHQETDGGHTGKVAIDGPYISANNRLGRPLQTMGKTGKKIHQIIAKEMRDCPSIGENISKEQLKFNAS